MIGRVGVDGRMDGVLNVVVKGYSPHGSIHTAYRRQRHVCIGDRQGVDNASLQGTEPSILVAEDLAPSETVRMDKSLLLGFITREGSSNSHTAILARSMNIPALIQCKDIQDDWDGKHAVVDGYNAFVYVDPTPDLLKSLKKRQQEDQKKQALLQ